MTRPAPGRLVAFQTMGCKLNQYESDALANEFQKSGFGLTNDFQSANICVINACTVTDKADRKSFAALARAKRQAGNASLIVITGCFAPDSLAHTDRYALESDGKTMVVDNHRKSQIPALCQARLSSEISPMLDPLPGEAAFAFQLGDKGFHTRPSLKIQDGCDRFCSYCAIPSARGPATSRPYASIETELRQLVAAGCREIVLTGVNLGDYQADGLDFTGLLKRLLDLGLPGGQDFRIRIGSLEPIGFGSDFAALFAHPRLCPSLQLCLQSGSDEILRAMRRGYTVAEFTAIVAHIRRVNPDFSLGTDLITGFPGESDKDFQASLDCLQALGCAHVHVFPYSRRHGTLADSLPEQIPVIQRETRAALIRQADLGWRMQSLTKRIGKLSQFLVEDISRAGNAISLSGRDQYGVLVRCELDANAAMDCMHRIGEPSHRPETPAMAAKSGQLGPIIGLWNQVLTVRAIAIQESGNGNPEPCLLAIPIDTEIGLR